MSDVTSMLAANLVEAFKQLNQVVTLGLVTSISALAVGKRRQLAPLSVIGKAIEDAVQKTTKTTATSSYCLAKVEARHSLTMFAYVTPNHLHQLNKA